MSKEWREVREEVRLLSLGRAREIGEAKALRQEPAWRVTASGGEGTEQAGVTGPCRHCENTAFTLSEMDTSAKKSILEKMLISS